jgi:hypothetical protein
MMPTALMSLGIDILLLNSPRKGAGKHYYVSDTSLQTLDFRSGESPVFEEIFEFPVGHLFLVSNPQDLLHMAIDAHVFDHPGLGSLTILTSWV